MLFLEVVGHILNVVPISLFEHIRGRVSHGDNSVCYVGQVEMLSLVGSGVFGTSYDFAHQTYHRSVRVLFAIVVIMEVIKVI